MGIFDKLKNPFKTGGPAKKDLSDFEVEMQKEIAKEEALLRGRRTSKAPVAYEDTLPDLQERTMIDPVENVSPFENTFLASEEKQGEKSGVRKTRGPREKLGFAEVEHDLAEKYTPYFLAEGGENIVYEIPGHPDVVLKGSKKILYDVLSDPEGEKVALEKAAKRIVRERELRSKLIKHFGAEHLLPQKQFLLKVPVTSDILEHTEAAYERFFRRTIPHDVKEAWTYVTIQKKQELKQGEYENPKAQYIDLAMLTAKPNQKNPPFFDPLVRGDFEFVTESLMRGDRTQAINEYQFANLMDSPWLARMLKEMRSDSELRDTVRDFVGKCIRFSEDTGEIIDFIGKDNIIFFKKNGHWTYKLLDPLFPFYDHVLEEAREIFVATKGEGARDMDNEKMNKIMQAALYVRMVNGLAMASKSETFLDFLPEELLEDDTVTSRIIPKSPSKEFLEEFEF